MSGNKNQTRLTLVYYIKFRVQKQNNTKQNDEKYNLTGITVKIHINHDGIRATAIMLSSIAASSSWRSSVIAVKQASGTTSGALRVEK